jgi:hypothetical protein
MSGSESESGGGSAHRASGGSSGTGGGIAFTGWRDARGSGTAPAPTMAAIVNYTDKIQRDLSEMLARAMKEQQERTDAQMAEVISQREQTDAKLAMIRSLTPSHHARGPRAQGQVRRRGAQVKRSDAPFLGILYVRACVLLALHVLCNAP